jgi:tight adherence protein B
MKNISTLFLFTMSFSVFAQKTAGDQAASSFNFFTDILGKKGLLITVGVLIFFYTYRNSVKLFAWIEDKTFGTRDYIMQKLELMHIEMDPNRITYILLFLYFGLGCIVFGIFALLGKILIGLIFATLVSVVGWKIPRLVVDLMEAARVKKYQDQMVDGLNLLSNGIRAGLSMPQAIGMVVDEMPPPLSQEFNLILQQAKIGVPLDEAMENLNKRMKTEDNQMFVTSVNILRESGGNLAETFDTIISVIRERIRLKQKIETYVAQGMFQGIVIFLMPYVMLGVNAAGNPEFLVKLFTTPVGIIMFLLILGFSCLGLWVIKKIVSIKV